MTVPIATNIQNAKPVFSKLIALANAGEAAHRVVRPPIPIMTHFLIVLVILHPSFFMPHFGMNIYCTNQNEQISIASQTPFVPKYIENFRNLQVNILPAIRLRRNGEGGASSGLTFEDLYRLSPSKDSWGLRSQRSV